MYNLKQTFLKVCIPGTAYQQALQNEFYILRCLYDNVALGIYALADDMSFLEEKCLRPVQKDLSPADTIYLINTYQEKLKNEDLSELGLYDIRDLLTESEYELNGLLHSYLDRYCYDKLFELLKCVKGWINTAPRVLCHGDLNRSNMMEDTQGKSIIVDWEDAFWGQIIMITAIG